MPADDGAARKARAQRLREQVKKVTTPQEGEQAPPAEGGAESPRDFIQRKMREVNDKGHS